MKHFMMTCATIALLSAGAAEAGQICCKLPTPSTSRSPSPVPSTSGYVRPSQSLTFTPVAKPHSPSTSTSSISSVSISPAISVPSSSSSSMMPPSHFIVPRGPLKSGSLKDIPRRPASPSHHSM